MGKPVRKKSKTTKSTLEDLQPLSSHSELIDHTSKDDEERRLESLLFGVPYVPSDVLQWDDSVGGKELENIADTDLFFVDDGAGEPSAAEGRASVGQEGVTSGLAPTLTSAKKPAWTDPDDTTLQVSLASNKRLRKLRDAPSDDTVGGREYERRLRRQYEKINPMPKWASVARQKLHPKRTKRRNSSLSSLSGTDDGDLHEPGIVSDLVSSTDGILRTSTKSTLLSQGILAIERLRDANQSAKSEGQVKAVQFHPSLQVPVLLTASSDRRLRLFHVDGLTNPHLQTLHTPTLPLTNAQFHPAGSSVLLTGPRPFYITYDLQSGSTHLSPRGLWGTTFNHLNPSSQDASMEICAFNPAGEVLAVAGRHGYVHLVDWKSGGGQVVGSLKMNAPVKSLWWVRGGSEEGRQLVSLGDDAEVYVWDVGERRCVRRWQDDGGFGSVTMSGDGAGKYLAIGSNIGLVNVYGSDGASSSNPSRPIPLKCIGNLTTSISTLRFNHDSQLLAMASNSKKDQMRLIHLSSLTAFSNWPTSSTPLGHVTSVDFSPRSEYLAVGNNRGRVLLYHLKDFGSH